MYKRYLPFLINKKIQISLIVLVALLVRVYYLMTSADQVLWWDEAEYMSSAKNWAFGVPYDFNVQRPPLFQLMATLFLKIGFEETALKFILVLIPAVILTLIVYYLGKELYNHKVGLISAGLTSFVWSLLFWSVRFQPDFLSLDFQLLAILFFWKFIKNNNSKYAIYTGLFCALGFYFKISALLVPLSIFLFSLYYEGLSFLRKKNYWLIFVAFIVGMMPFMIWQWIYFGNPLAFAPSYSGDFNEGRSLGWMTLYFFYNYNQPSYSFPKLLFFVLFVIGIATFLGKSVFGVDLLLKEKENRKDADAYSFIFLLVTSLFYLFYIKGVIEDRWVFLLVPFTFFFAAKVALNISSFLQKYHKILPSVFLIIIFIMFLIPQINHANSIIDSKKGTYLPVKEASLVIKGNSLTTDKVLSISYTQTTAYAEREVITYSKWPIENFTKTLIEKRPKFVIASILEPHHPDWMVQQVQNEQGYRGILFPYFNSTIVASPQGQIVQYDLKERVTHGNATFTLIYPYDNNFGGLVAYKIDYKE